MSETDDTRNSTGQGDEPDRDTVHRRSLLRRGVYAAGVAGGLGVAATAFPAPAWASGTAPTGPAGGALTGSYPNPGLGAATVGDAHIDSTDPIGRDKLVPPEARHIVGAVGEPAFGSGWSNLGTGTHRDLSFWYDDGTEMVHVEGMVTSSGAGYLVFTLPTDYRPAKNMAGLAKEFFGSTVFDWGVAPSGDLTIAPVASVASMGLTISLRLGS